MLKTLNFFVVDILETKVELEDPLPVRQVRELYKECRATGRILPIFLAALHAVQVCHTTIRCVLYLEVFCIVLVKEKRKKKYIYIYIYIYITQVSTHWKKSENTIMHKQSM